MYAHVSTAKSIEMLNKAYNSVTMKNALLVALDSLNYNHSTHLHSYSEEIPVEQRLEDWSDHYEMNIEINLPGISNEITLNGKMTALESQSAEITGYFGED